MERVAGGRCGSRVLAGRAYDLTGAGRNRAGLGSEMVLAGMLWTTQSVMSLPRLPAGTATSTSCMMRT